MDLKDKVAIVTGASSGIGAEFARMLVEKETHVYGLARRIDPMNQARQELGERFHPVQCDVRNENDIKRAVDSIIEQMGRIDILINNAGLGKNAAVTDLSSEDWDTLMETNLRGVFLCSRAVIPQMKKQNAESGFGGYIINIASIAGLIGNPNISAYNASKFGVRGFSEALMKEVRSDGIKVTCVYPGSIQTDFSSVAGTTGATHAMLPSDIGSTIVHLLETRDNYLISEVVMRPLRPRG